MKKILLTLTLALGVCFIASAQAEWIGFNRYAEANSSVTAAPKAVFMGDSITDGWFSSDPAFFNDNNFLGRGISGQVTSQMVLRFRNDVIAHHPKYVVILGGINDIAQNKGPIDIEDTFNNVVTMVEMAKANKIKPVICLLFPTDLIPWRHELGPVNPKIDAFNEMVRNYGKTHNVKVVEYLKDVDKSSGNLPKSISNDSVHPNLDGYKIMEQEILKVLK